MNVCGNRRLRQLVQCVDKSCKEMDPLLKGIARKVCKKRRKRCC